MSNISFVDDGASLIIPRTNQSNIIPVNSDDSVTLAACSYDGGLLDIETQNKGCDIVITPAIHNALLGLQGGILTERYHLTRKQWQAVNEASNPSASNPFATIADITGGGDSDLVHKFGNETIDGIKTFLLSPVVPNASMTNQAVAFGQLANYTPYVNPTQDIDWTGKFVKALQFQGNVSTLPVGSGSLNINGNNIDFYDNTGVLQPQGIIFGSGVTYKTIGTLQHMFFSGATKLLEMGNNGTSQQITAFVPMRVNSAPVLPTDVVRLQDLGTYSGLSTPSNQSYQIV